MRSTEEVERFEILRKWRLGLVLLYPNINFAMDCLGDSVHESNLWTSAQNPHCTSCNVLSPRSLERKLWTRILQNWTGWFLLSLVLTFLNFLLYPFCFLLRFNDSHQQDKCFTSDLRNPGLYSFLSLEKMEDSIMFLVSLHS